MKKIFWIVPVLLILAGSPGHAVLGFGDSVESLWPEKPVQIDGRATEWSEMPVVEDGGLSFRAMNDASNLYLLICGTNSDGRVILAGKYRQNVTLWFLKPDHKTHSWGINIDFSRAHPADPQAAPTLDAFGVTPEIVMPQGLEVSTAPFSTDMELQADLSSQRGRQPVYEIRIPLSLLKEIKSRRLDLAFTTAEVSPDVKTELQSRPEEPPAGNKSQSGNQNGSPPRSGGRHGHGMGGGGAGGNSSHAVEIPKPLNIHLTVKLVKGPKH
jgi:hypothetical protein